MEKEAWNPRIIENSEISIHFHDFLNGEGSVGNPEQLKMKTNPCISCDFFNGEGNVGNPESLKMDRFPYIFHDFLDGEGIVGNPESLNMQRFHCIFMISLMEREEWETQNH